MNCRRCVFWPARIRSFGDVLLTTKNRLRDRDARLLDRRIKSRLNQMKQVNAQPAQTSV
jgi:hypothetical protein